MTTRHTTVSLLNLIVSATLAGAVLVPIAQSAANAAVTAADVVQQPYTGVLNTDNVYVRSGPSDVFYATTKLNKGDHVTVVSVQNDCVKIVPPDGSYCYVAKTYIEKQGDGTTGRALKSELNVRTGSNLNGLKTTVPTQLDKGDTVKILGEETEYFKIVPPPGAYLYIKKMYVDPAPQVAAAPLPVMAAAKQADPIASEPIPAVAPAVVSPAVVAPAVVAPVAVALSPIPTVQISMTPAVPAPATQPAVAIAPSTPTTQPAVAMTPAATQPVQLSADEKFDELESAFLDATSLPLDKQPVEMLLTKYTALSTDTSLPASMHRIVDRRVATLKLRSDAQTQMLATQKMQADAVARRISMKAENDELIQRVKDQSVSIYTALGTLRISSLQQTGATMYRLTDPGTGRTLLYVRSNDAKYTGLLNQFIGVKGDITDDTSMNLKVIAPTAAEAVDQSKVNSTITATVIPPSLLPKTTTASVNGN